MQKNINASVSYPAYLTIIIQPLWCDGPDLRAWQILTHFIFSTTHEVGTVFIIILFYRRRKWITGKSMYWQRTQLESSRGRIWTCIVGLQSPWAYSPSFAMVCASSGGFPPCELLLFFLCFCFCFVFWFFWVLVRSELHIWHFWIAL